MANSDHLTVLRQGAEAWNAWKDKSFGIKPDLRKADLSKADLSKANLSKANLNEADLNEANLRKADLNEANLRKADLNEANLSEADLNEADLNEANLSEANLNFANLSKANLRKANLSDADLNFANLSKADLSKADLRKADLRKANLRKANLSDADLSDADLSFVDLSEADLSFVDLSFADLSNTYLSNTYLSFANLNFANLRKANLSGANLNFANLSDANLSEVDLSEVDLRKANLRKANLSEVDLSEVDLSEVDLSEVDLSGANLSGANLSGANLSGANLSGANLIASQVLKTDFSQATLTGACIEDWNINAQTELQDVICERIYLRYDSKNGFTDRRPHDLNKSFAAREFAALVQKSLETVDLIFVDGIDWKAFFRSFQQLQQKYHDDNLGIQAIEKKNDAFVIRLEVSPDADKAGVEQDAKTLYQTQVKVLEAHYHAELQAKDKEIESYRRESANMVEITRLLAGRPIQIAEPKVTLNSTQIKVLQAIQNGMNNSEEIAQSTKLSVDNVSYYLESMEKEGFLRCSRTFDGESCELTNKGRVAIDNPDLLLPSSKGTTHYNISNNKFGGGAAFGENASQSGGTFYDLSTNIHNNLDDITRLIQSLRQLTQSFPSAHQNEANDHLNDLEDDLQQAPKKRKSSRVKATLAALLALSIGIGGAVATATDFTNNVLELSNKLGIELVQPQTTQQPIPIDVKAIETNS